MPRKNQHTKRNLWNYMAIGLVSADLLVAGWGSNPGINKDFYKTEKEERIPSRAVMDKQTEYEIKFNNFFRFDTFAPGRDWDEMRTYLVPNLNMLQRLEMVNNFDPILPGRYQIWLDELSQRDMKEEQQLLKLMKVNSILELDHQGELIILENVHPENDGIELIGCAVYVATENEALNLILNSKLNFNNKIVIEEKFTGDNPCLLTLAEYSIVEEKPGYIKLDVELGQGGWILWSQTWYPGWRGLVDDKPTKVYRANYLFQAIYSPAGSHDVVFKYHPRIFLLGIGGTLVGLLFVAGGIAIKRKT
jgi:hypothetical protein